MGVTDLLGAGKFTEKLIGVVEKGSGAVYNDIMEPKRLAKKGQIDADNKKKMIIAEAEGYSEALKIKAKSDLEVRTMQRISFQETKKQENLENILQGASEMGEGETSDEPVDDDWITRFFNIAGDVSSEKVQVMWSSILAGEVKKPGSYSFRSLETLRNINQSEAENFKKLSGFISTDGFIVKIGREFDEIAKISGVSYDKLLGLVEAGLINSNFSLGFNNIVEDKDFPIRFNKKVVLCRSKKGKKALPVFSLTSVGKELFRMLSSEINEKYLEGLCAYLELKGYEHNIVITK